MKHNIKITAILLVMFLVTQLIGLAVVHTYSPKTQTVFNQTTGLYENVTVPTNLPYGFQPPEMEASASLTSIIIAMVIAVVLILLLMRFRVKIFLRLWFFFVIAIALGITINTILMYFNLSPYYALILAIPLAFLKIFKQNLIVHNVTELLIYPGLAAVFVPILNIWTAGIFLILLSLYDMYAVWHAGFMQKMAKFQINELKIFGGFFLPYMNKKEKAKIELLKDKYRNKIPKSVLKNKKIKVNLTILGGGDVVFPIIFSGVVLLARGFLPAIIITLFATLSLLGLFILARKGRFYPAMPFLTIGCFLGYLIGLLLV